MTNSFYGFEIPHAVVKPARDIVAIQIPFPPRKIGSVVVPDMVRDLAQHGVQMGIIRAMGPLAFQYKDGAGLSRQAAEIGDWVLIKWGAGTMFAAAKGIMVTGGWRYISSFGDVIGVVSSEEALANGIDPEKLEWVEGDDEKLGLAGTAIGENSKEVDPFAHSVRERVVYDAVGHNAGQRKDI